MHASQSTAANLPLPDADAEAHRVPLVSIMLITYNHEKYIGQAIESILMQETQYRYEINVIEDCSTDKTQEVVMRYVEKHPDKVKPFFNKKNIGYKVTQKNFVRGFKTLLGDYIAILEGDDYWTSPHKLEKQVSFLETHPDYIACAHNVIKMYEDGSQPPSRFLYWPGKPERHTIHDLILLQSYFHTSTLTYRNVFKGNPPAKFINPWSCDIFDTIAHAQYGDIRYFDDDMSVYRAHSGGRFSTMKTLEGWFFNIGGLRRYNAWLQYRYLKTFSLSIVRYCNVVLHDKGKEAALPMRWQAFKILTIRSIYQFIYCVACTPDKVPFNPPACAADHATLKEIFAVTLRNTPYMGLYCLKIVLAFFVQVMEAFTAVTYSIIAHLLPESAKDAVRKFEKSHPSIRYLRRLKREGKLFSVRSIKVMLFFALRSLGFKARATAAAKKLYGTASI